MDAESGIQLKTTITVEPDQWQKFQQKVLAKEKQARKLNAVVNKLIEGYVDGRFDVRA